MDQEILLPALDQAVLKEKAAQFAMQGAIKSLEEYYSGYNSPYRKAINEKLKAKDIGVNFELPDIIAYLNDALSAEVDKVANEAIALTFIPMMQRFLIREDKEMKFSQVLRKIIKEVDDVNQDDCRCEVEKNHQYNWLTIKIELGEKNYSLTLHSNRYRTSDPDTYTFLGLPYESSRTNRTMKVTSGDVSIDMPFTSDVLHDNVISFIARLVIAKTVITMDTDDFDEDMFEHECHC